MGGKIFISYRRVDDAPTWRLYELLEARFGSLNIWIDAKSLEPPVPFLPAIKDAVGQSAVLLVVIGRNWVQLAERNGSRRIDNSEDVVRLEVEVALEREICVMPVLVNGAEMPREEDLPNLMKPLAGLQAVELRNQYFSEDTKRLVKAVEFELEAPGDARQRAFKSIVNDASELLHAESCELFALDEYGETLELKASTNKNLIAKMKNNKCKPYERGRGLTGWIFKTGKPLLIEDTTKFKRRRRLTNEQLITISNGEEINQDDLFIKGENLNKSYEKTPPNPSYLGVPIKSKDDEVLGVIRVFLPNPPKERFSKEDMLTLQNLANSLFFILNNDKQERLKKLLISIGAETNKKKLFTRVVMDTPHLVLGRGCSIFLKKKREEKPLELKYTNSKHLTNKATGKPRDITYDLGEGKTGFVAKIGRSLLVNHYGVGTVDKKRRENDCEKYTKDPHNLVSAVNNKDGEIEGLARLVSYTGESAFSTEEQSAFKNFVEKKLCFEKGTLAGKKGNECETGSGGAAKCFLAVPLKDQAGDVFGVLRIPRTYSGGIFTDDDLRFVQSIVDRLTSALEPESFLQQNLEKLTEINREINSPGFSQEEILENILKAVTDTLGLGFEFATISRVDQARGTIKTEMCMKNSDVPDAVDPGAWMKKSHHKLQPRSGVRDIQAEVIMRKISIIVKGKDKKWMKHLHKQIFEEHGHKDLVRAFVPIIAFDPLRAEGDREIRLGTIEAGHHMSRKDEISQRKFEMLRAFASQAAIAIRNREYLVRERERNQMTCLADASQVSLRLADIESALGDLGEGVELKKVCRKITAAIEHANSVMQKCSNRPLNLH